MKTEFLEKLAGMTVFGATNLCKKEGYEVEVVDEGCEAMAAIALPNTVVLWEKPKGMVGVATAGDPLELDP